MPKLPTASDYQYGGAQATRGISSVNMSQAGAGAEALGRGLSAYADVEKERQSKSELAVARNEFLRQELATRSQIEQSEKYGEYEQNYGKGVAEARNKALMMVGDDAVREQLATEFDGDIIRGQYQMRQAAFRKRQEFDKANVINIGDETLKSIMETDDLSTRNKLLQSMNEAIDSSIGFDPVRRQALKRQYNENAAEVIIGQMPADKKLALASGASKGVAPKTFEETLPLLHKVEGGYNPDDGASKAPALYGINRKHHPEKFDEVYALREAGREGEAIAVANQFYKEEFWDKNNIDELPEDTRAIVFDAFVNQGNFGKKLYAAAENGATAGQLLEARRAEYNRLAESPEYAPSHGGWMKRIATVADATGVNPEGSDLFRMLSPEKQLKLKQEAEIEFATQEMRFAPPERRAEIASRFSDNPSVMSSYNQVQAALKSDPAGYVASHPSVILSQEAGPEAVLAATKKAQIDMGVPDYRAKYVSKGQAEELKALLSSSSTAPDQMLSAIDGMKDSSGGVWNDVVGELRDYGIKGPVSILAGMDNQVYRSELAAAIHTGNEGFDKIIPKPIGMNLNAEISNQVNSALEPYQNVMGRVGGTQPIIADMRSSMTLLTKQYMSKGMALNEAAAEAKAAILPDDVYGTLILPKGTDGALVEMHAEDYRSMLDAADIVTPRNIDVAQQMEYAEKQIRDAIPVVTDNNKRVTFIGLNGGPLIDKNKARYNKDGELLNADEAKLSFAIEDALTLSDEADLLAPENSVGNSRASVSSMIGEDIKKYYSPRAAINGVQYFGKYPKVGSEVITQDSFKELSPADKKIAKDKIRQNVEYNKLVMGLAEKSGGADQFKQFISASGEAALRKIDAQKKLKSYAEALPRDRAITDDQPEMLAKLKKAAHAEMVGAGLQYLEVPEWAK
jgi:hypothetical protein